MNDFGKFLICMGFIVTLITLTGCSDIPIIPNVNSCYEIHAFTKEVFYCENVERYYNVEALNCNDGFRHLNIESYKKIDDNSKCVK